MPAAGSKQTSTQVGTPNSPAAISTTGHAFVLCVGYDYYAAVQHWLDGFDAAGRHVYLGCQIKELVTNTVGQWNAAYGYGLNVQGFFPGGSGGGTDQQTGWIATPAFPDYIQPPQWNGGAIEVDAPY